MLDPNIIGLIGDIDRMETHLREMLEYLRKQPLWQDMLEGIQERWLRVKAAFEGGDKESTVEYLETLLLIYGIGKIDIHSAQQS